jgi:hypothetical protein
MMRIKIAWFLSVVVMAGVMGGCSPRAKYERRLKRELASGERHDSLFMGISLGMPQKDFYTHCWELNRQGLIRQGTNNTTVEYRMRNELKHAATMNFYPTFVQGKIAEMPVKFAYSGWAPWNKKLSADSLQIDVLTWYKEVYGNDFIAIKHPERGMAYVKIDGNRRISIFKENDLYVWAIFTDLLVRKDLIDSVFNTVKTPDSNTDTAK